MHKKHLILSGVFVLLAIGLWVSKPFTKDVSLQGIIVTTTQGQTSIDTLLDDKTILYFGYTTCPTICPMTLSTIAQALQSKPTKVLFITLDSTHDTPALLQNYLNGYHPMIRGGVVSDADLERFAESLNLNFTIKNDKILHSGNIYIFKNGTLTTTLPFGISSEELLKAL